jgi:Leucine-rich repeat (LRR) protein
MKKICLIVCILSYLNGKNTRAQYVNIPDPNFVTVLQMYYPSCMSGTFLDTTCSQVTNEWDLDCTESNIYDLTGIQYFDNLLGLNCSHNPLTTLPPLPNNLQNLTCEECSLTTLPALPLSLRELACWGNSLTFLPTPLPNLTFLNCSFNPLYVLPPLPSSITTLACVGNYLTNLSGLPPGLQWLECSQNDLTQLPPLPATMYVLDVSSNPITCLPPINFINIFNWDNTNIQCLPNPINIPNANPSIIGMPQCDSASGCPFVCSLPSLPSHHIAFTNVTSNSVTVNWTNGNGSRRIVKIKPTNTFTAPVNGNDYSANSVYTGSGEQVVYNGTGNSVTVTGLSSNRWYWFRVYEASCSGNNSLYLSSVATGNPKRVFTLPYYNPNRAEDEQGETSISSIIFYPNPTSGDITIESTKENPIESLFVYRTEGNILKSIITHNSEIINVDLQGLSSGIYFLDCQTENGSEKVKVVKY